MRQRARLILLRLAGVRCGAYGGEVARQFEEIRRGPVTRWCLKPFGHIESCAFEVCDQPDIDLRQFAKGWK